VAANHNAQLQFNILHQTIDPRTPFHPKWAYRVRDPGLLVFREMVTIFMSLQATSIPSATLHCYSSEYCWEIKSSSLSNDPSLLVDELNVRGRSDSFCLWETEFWASKAFSRHFWGSDLRFECPVWGCLDFPVGHWSRDWYVVSTSRSATDHEIGTLSRLPDRPLITRLVRCLDFPNGQLKIECMRNETFSWGKSVLQYNKTIDPAAVR